ncbi:hypothetical protein QTN47_22035 [Danxiaibacter flavus]|uniref:Sugar ABC transporter permease n=1 Tax=Danxiaibacter flavus TaxID=3049108 RepID=A0ABV3ZJZ4_9BACT|nr:hypothetical protein QNM32_22040 [Chitinophagaceae bacterium DXS]
MAKATRDKIGRSIFLSLFLYALPILLMFLYLSITGQKPWLKKANAATEQTK